MTQRQLNRAIASATGESVSTIARLGFVHLTAGPVERDPHFVDWDDLGAEHPGIFPSRSSRRPGVA